MVYWLRLIICLYCVTVPLDWNLSININNTSPLSKKSRTFFMKPAHHLGPKSDTIAEIYTVRKDIGLTLTGVHVKSHQRFKIGEMKLIHVQLNEYCNKQARLFIFISDTTWRMRLTTIVAPTAQVSLLINGNLITNNYNDRLQTAWTAIGMQTHYTKTWLCVTFNAINWQTLKSAIKTKFKSSKKKYYQTMKFMLDLKCTGHNHKKMTTYCTIPTLSNKCPCYKSAYETTFHVYCCPDETIKAFLTDS